MDSLLHELITKISENAYFEAYNGPCIDLGASVICGPSLIDHTLFATGIVTLNSPIDFVYFVFVETGERICAV